MAFRFAYRFLGFFVLHMRCYICAVIDHKARIPISYSLGELRNNLHKSQSNKSLIRCLFGLIVCKSWLTRDSIPTTQINTESFFHQSLV